MKIILHSTIQRYEGEYVSLSAFMLSPSPRIGDKEEVHLAGAGSFKGGVSDFLLSYTENETEQKVSLLYKDGVLRFSHGKTVADFVPGKLTAFSHEMGYGVIEQTVYTESVTVKEREGKYLVSLVYLAHFSGMVQKNKMMWKIET